MTVSLVLSHLTVHCSGTLAWRVAPRTPLCGVQNCNWIKQTRIYSLQRVFLVRRAVLCIVNAQISPRQFDQKIMSSDAWPFAAATALGLCQHLY